MYRKCVPPVLVACFLPLPLRPPLPSITPSQAAPFLATSRPSPRSHLAPFRITTLYLLPAVSLRRFGNHRLVGTPPTATSQRLSQISEHSGLPHLRGARVQSNLGLQRCRVLEKCIVPKRFLHWTHSAPNLSGLPFTHFFLLLLRRRSLAYTENS
jgi:hypothetical protein